MSDAPKVVDLDALQPQPVTIKLGEKEIQIPPPKTADILRLGTLGQQMEKVGELDDAQLEKLVDDITGQLRKLIPEIGDYALNMAQLLKLVEIINQMAIPKDTQEAERQGISSASPKPAA